MIGAGLLQTLFGVLRLGGLVKFVPYPVVAGFMNGVAILIVLSQLPALMGLPARGWPPFAAGDWARFQPGTLAVGRGDRRDHRSWSPIVGARHRHS